MENWPFLDQNYGLTLLEKCQFSNFFNFLFLQPRKAFFFVLEYRKRYFPGLYCLKKKVEKKAIFGLKPCVNPFGIHVGEHISLGICVSQVGEHISLGICVSQVGNTYHQGYVFPKSGNTYHQRYVFPRKENTCHQRYVFPRQGNT